MEAGVVGGSLSSFLGFILGGNGMSEVMVDLL